MQYRDDAILWYLLHSRCSMESLESIISMILSILSFETLQGDERTQSLPRSCTESRPTSVWRWLKVKRGVSDLEWDAWWLKPWLQVWFYFYCCKLFWMLTNMLVNFHYFHALYLCPGLHASINLAQIETQCSCCKNSSKLLPAKLCSSQITRLTKTISYFTQINCLGAQALQLA